MDIDIKTRFDALIKRGAELIARIPRDEDGPRFWIPTDDVPVYQAWLSSSANLITALTAQDNPLSMQVASLLRNEGLKNGVPSKIIFQMQGHLTSAGEEFNHGLLGKIEYIVAAATFDDFLDHAAIYHKGNKKIEASVLASAVLEDTVKKIARKNNLVASSTSQEPLIEDLVKAGVLTAVKAKRVKSLAAIRNHALHAEWDKIDIRDAGELIAGIRDLIENYL